MSPPSIDHHAFPHLIDSIIGYAPHGSLVALRAASRAFRDRCDALLVQHIVLSNRFQDVQETAYGQIPFPVRLEGRNGRIPSFSDWDSALAMDLSNDHYAGDWKPPRQVPNNPRATRLADLDWQPERGYHGPIQSSYRRKRHSSSAKLLANTRVVDIIGPVCDKRRCELLSALSPDVMLRFRVDSHGRSPWSRRPGCEGSLRGWEHVYEGRVGSFVSFESVDEPVPQQHSTDSAMDDDPRIWLMDGAERVVRNLFFSPSGKMAEIRESQFPPSVREVVLVFQRKTSSEVKGDGKGTAVGKSRSHEHTIYEGRQYRARANYGPLFWTLAAAAKYLPATRLTLVGADTLPAASFLGEDTPASVRDDVFRLVEKVVRSHAADVWNMFDDDYGFGWAGEHGQTVDELVERAMRGLRVITMAEYEAERGAEMFALETRE